MLSMQASKVAVEKDLARARSMVKDLLDKHVVVNAESEQKMENLNVSDLLSSTLNFDPSHMVTGALHCVGKVNRVQTAGYAVRGAACAGAGVEG